MTTPATQGYPALTEKEKQTLRMIVRGHDAKSIANSLGLSVHTINERLREARRKMAVSSSREAARMLLDTEGPNSLGDVRIGEAAPRSDVEQECAPIPGDRPTIRFAWITLGVVAMTLMLGFLALAALPQIASTSTQGQTAAGEAADPAVVATAQAFLTLVDQRRWDDSYRMTGTAFRKLNSRQVWASASERVRTPLGVVRSRVLIGQQEVPAPPRGYEMVKFRTSFANKADAVETVTLDREPDGWHVVGVTII